MPSGPSAPGAAPVPFGRLDPTPPVDLVAGRYRLLARRGQGAMGAVWEGLDEALGRRVAVKLLLMPQPDEVTAARFSLEARTAALLSNPHVVTVYDAGVEDDLPYLVTELLDGRNLAEELADRGAFCAEGAADIGRQVAEGLAAAHERGVVHRDVKPANVLVGRDGAAKVADFGIARFADEATAGLTATGEVLGTCAYLAPERCLGRPAGPSADVYALGCVLYELLVGGPPFRADTAAGVIYQHVDTPPDPLRRHRGDAVPPALEDFVLRMLAKQPDERPTARETADFLGDAGRWSEAAVASDGGVGSASVSAPVDAVVRAQGRPAGPAEDGTHVHHAAVERSRKRSPRALAGMTVAALTGATVLGLSISAFGPDKAAPVARTGTSHSPTVRPGSQAGRSSGASGPGSVPAKEPGGSAARVAGPPPVTVASSSLSGASATPPRDREQPAGGGRHARGTHAPPPPPPPSRAASASRPAAPNAQPPSSLPTPPPGPPHPGASDPQPSKGKDRKGHRPAAS